MVDSLTLCDYAFYVIDELVILRLWFPIPGGWGGGGGGGGGAAETKRPDCIMRFYSLCYWKYKITFNIATGFAFISK